MDPVSALVGLLAAGASAALSKVAGKAVEDAYEGLKGILAGRLVSLGLLEQDPKSEPFRSAVAEEAKTKNLADNPEVLAKLDDLSKALEAVSQDQRDRLGVDIQQIRAAKDVIIRQITSAGGIMMRDVDSKTGKVEIEGLRTGTPAGN